MNKKELIDVVYEKTGLTKIASKEAIDVVFDSIIKALCNGEEVRLAGFGTLVTSERGQRKVRNPQTGEEMTVEAKKVIKFRPAKAFKTAVN